MAVVTKALVIGSFGARGTGKTAWIMQAEARTPALAIWDYKHDPRMASWGTSYTDLAAFIRALEARTFTARYLVDRAGGALPVPRQFEIFCSACFLRGNMRMFVDELPAVTRAYKAPDAWRECVNIGREYRGADGRVRTLGISITAQRPSEIDKSLIGNLDVVHAGRLPFKNDAVSIAGTLGVPAGDLMQLPDLHWIERRSDRTEATRGVLTFGNSARAPAAKKVTSGARRP
jgi:hypothetical protein